MRPNALQLRADIQFVRSHNLGATLHDDVGVCADCRVEDFTLAAEIPVEHRPGDSGILRDHQQGDIVVADS